MNNRRKKAAAVFPRPVAGLLRPVVHPPTQRYNFKLRLGKGFTLGELREAKVPVKLAPTIGISVDWRRKNRCQESLTENVDRLKMYLSKLMIFPNHQLGHGIKGKAKKGPLSGYADRKELDNLAQNTLKEIIPVPKPALREKARAITSEEKSFEAYKTMKKARSDLKYWGSKKKKADEKSAKEAMK